MILGPSRDLAWNWSPMYMAIVESIGPPLDRSTSSVGDGN